MSFLLCNITRLPKNKATIKLFKKKFKKVKVKQTILSDIGMTWTFRNN